jgi:Mg2+ and Co2+ transporter CorA
LAIEAYQHVSRYPRLDEYRDPLFLTSPFAILTSWFGMNFKRMPFDDHEYGVWIYTGIMAVMALGLFLWVRKRKWF